MRKEKGETGNDRTGGEVEVGKSRRDMVRGGEKRKNLGAGARIIFASMS